MALRTLTSHVRTLLEWRREAEELAYALKTRVGAKNAFGGNEPMRLSVAHSLQPALSKARGEAEKYRAEKNLLLRHNRHLLLEINRLQSVAQQRAVTPQQAMSATGGEAGLVAAAMASSGGAETTAAGAAAGAGAEPGPYAMGGGAPDVISWPPSGADTVQLRRQYDELKNEFRAQVRATRQTSARRLRRTSTSRCMLAACKAPHATPMLEPPAHTSGILRVCLTLTGQGASGDADPKSRAPRQGKRGRRAGKGRQRASG